MWRLLPLLLLPAAAVAFAAFGWQEGVLWGQIAQRLQDLQAAAKHDPAIAGPLFVLAYAGFATLCLPTGPAMGVLGGALFGPWLGTALALAGATAGALPLFLWARATIGGIATGRFAASVAEVRRRLQRDGFLALLALRIAPVLPSWGLNLAAALAGMRVRPFVAATAIGLLPATAVFAHIGAGLSGIIAETPSPGPGLLTRPAILLPLLALSALALIPVALRLLRARAPDQPGIRTVNSRSE